MSSSARTASRRTAVVIGGGMTGMLAAAVLADFADVRIIERDVLPAAHTPERDCRRPAMPTCSGPAA